MLLTFSKRVFTGPQSVLNIGLVWDPRIKPQEGHKGCCDKGDSGVSGLCSNRKRRTPLTGLIKAKGVYFNP